MLFARLQHGAPFLDAFGERFLDIDIFAGLAGQNRRQRMPMVRRRDQHHIDVLAVEDAPKVLYGVRLFAAFGLANLDPFGNLRLIDITDHGAIDLWIEEKTFQIAAPHAAAADQAEANFFIRPRLARARGSNKWRTECAQRQRDRAGSQSRFA